jgi:hypothetical protein
MLGAARALVRLDWLRFTHACLGTELIPEELEESLEPLCAHRAGTRFAGDRQLPAVRRDAYLDRLGRPAPQGILDWAHDELPPSA